MRTEGVVLWFKYAPSMYNFCILQKSLSSEDIPSKTSVTWQPNFQLNICREERYSIFQISTFEIRSTTDKTPYHKFALFDLECFENTLRKPRLYFVFDNKSLEGWV